LLASLHHPSWDFIHAKMKGYHTGIETKICNMLETDSWHVNSGTLAGISHPSHGLPGEFLKDYLMVFVYRSGQKGAGTCELTGWGEQQASC
jgi:hypothetical protein